MTSARRLTYIDWARGIAVLIMIEAHTLDAWTRAADRRGVWFGDASILGGFAAPMFLWLAGVGVAMSAARTYERTGSRSSAADSIARRGLEIFILAFLFRLQAFILSPGAHPVTLFRVDILNVMGPAIVATGIVWACGTTAAVRVLALGVAATFIAMITPVIRQMAAIDALPAWIQWYLRPTGDHTTFTGLPWAGFVFAGGAVGVLIAEMRDERLERRLQIALALTGAALIALGFYTAAQPSIYRASSFWTSSPTWFCIRTGILMLALAGLYLFETMLARAGVALRPLARMGQSSLFVYWIHVELVYGYASWWWHRRLPLWGTALAYAAFCTLIYGAVRLRDRIVDARRTRAQRAGPTRQIVTA
ncbi:MAG: acyltransferase [Acidobacteriia bacterium]|nr:acyltransferase [Terriglobia bacterium]